MCDTFQAAHGRWSKVRLTLLLCAITALGAPRPAEAHNFLSEFIQHGIRLTVGAEHVDITVDLTFFEEWSARERAVMDADGSGNITRTELESYLNKLAPQLSRQIGLRVAGRELTLIPLYDPEVDLLADDKVGSSHHRLRLFFFVSTPGLAAGDEIVIEDRLWPEAKALATPQIEGRDGCKLTTLVAVDAALATARSQEEKRLFKFRCLQPPNKPAESMNNPTRSAAKVAGPSAFPQPSKSSATHSMP